MSLSLLHQRLANTALLYTLVLALWTFYLVVRRRDLSPNYWGALAINELLFIIQGLIGLLLVFQGLAGRVQWVHFLYGSVGVITLPGLFAYTRGRGTHREALLYGIGLLFLAGVVLRAAGTAMPVVGSPDFNGGPLSP